MLDHHHPWLCGWQTSSASHAGTLRHRFVSQSFAICCVFDCLFFQKINQASLLFVTLIECHRSVLFWTHRRLYVASIAQATVYIHLLNHLKSLHVAPLAPQFWRGLRMQSLNTGRFRERKALKCSPT